MSFLTELAERFVPDIDDRQRIAAAEAALATGGESAARAYLDGARILGEAAADGAALLAALPGPDAPVIDLIGALVAASFATVQATYPTRPDAQAARAALATRAGATINDAGAEYGPEVHAFLMRLTGEALVQVSAIAATRAPLVRVETGVSLPSSLLAFDLYGDPDRGAELVRRNDIGTPMIMPVAFEAIAS